MHAHRNGAHKRRREPVNSKNSTTFWASLQKTLFPSNLDRGEGTCLESAADLFDPKTLVILETAFDEAWITLKTNGTGNIRPDELARRICHLAMEGERDPVRLHDRALGELIPATIWRELS
jgi:hypothetical protein